MPRGRNPDGILPPMGASPRTWDLLADLPVDVGGVTFERLELAVSAGWTRVTTVVRIEGGGEVGVGEDVSYSAADHDRLQAAGPPDLRGRDTLAGFSARLERLELWPAPPESPAYRDYRRWAFESAALDLALRQSGRSLAQALGRDAAALTFVVSLGLGGPPTAAPLTARRALAPGLRFKLDPTSAWDDALVADLQQLGGIDVLDLKGFYKGTVVDQAVDPPLYRRVVEGFPDAWIEDAVWNAETEEVLAPHRDRLTWDAPIHSVEDALALPVSPRALNCKPSRFGPLRRLFDFYDHCAANGIALYGGGQFELGPGRAHIQLLASLFHADAANDTAPSAWNAAELEAGLPTSPLALAPRATGFALADPA